MTPTRRRFIGTTTVTYAFLAGCLGGDGETDEPEPTETDTPETTAGATIDGTPTETTSTETDPAEGSEAAVVVASHPTHGDILVDGEGSTLYMFDSDDQGSGASTCSGDCLDAWPPLATEGDPAVGEAVTADVTTFEREDGTTQVAANGWPLYYFASDEEPGDASGQGASDVWWVLDPDGEPGRPDENDGGTGESAY